VTIAVVDASVWLDALLPGPRRDTARAAIDAYDTISAPEHLWLEIAQVLRRYASSNLDSTQAASLITTLAELDLSLKSTAELLPRIWELRDILSVYDAAYIAAAEQCGAELLTRDEAMLACTDTARCPIHDIS
jgi:predicted nucleic acid-binding protein